MFMDNVFELNLKTKSRFGPGQALNLGKYLKELSFGKIGVIIDSSIADNPYCQEILKNLGGEQFAAIGVWKYDLGAEPDYDSLDRVKLLFLDQESRPKVDCFVGIGGGSVIDFAKALATVTVNPGEAIRYRGFPANINPSLPTIAIPTTAGTGSEITYNASLIYWKDKKKMGINSPHNFPVLAILDPNLTMSCPPKVTASSGIDALVHAVESYSCRRSNSLSKSLAKEAFGLVFNNLSSVLEAPNDLEIRANLQIGAFLAGMSIAVAGGGPSSGLSYPLGVHFKVPHGLAGGIFLPHVVEFNMKNGYDYSELYKQIEGARVYSDRRKNSRLFSQRLFDLNGKLRIPSSLREFGISKGNIGILLKEAEQFEGSFSQNPVAFSVEDAKRLMMKTAEVNRQG